MGNHSQCQLCNDGHTPHLQNGTWRHASGDVCEEGERLRLENEALLAVLCPEEVSELERTRKLNDVLRNYLAASDMDCVFCGLPKADMAKCAQGFPGCSRADDLTI